MQVAILVRLMNLVQEHPEPLTFEQVPAREVHRTITEIFNLQLILV